MSWIIVSKGTGEAVFETWSKELTLKINTEKYKVLTAMKYLQSINNKNLIHENKH